MSPSAQAIHLGGSLYLPDGRIAGASSDRFDIYGDTIPVGGEHVGTITGTSRTTHSGDLVLTSAMSGTSGNPTIIENLDITGRLRKGGGSHILVRNFRVRGGPANQSGSQTGNTPLIDMNGSGSNITLEDFEVDPSHPSVWIYGVHGYGYTARRFWIHDCTDGIVSHTDSSIRLEGGIVDRVLWWSYDPNQSDGSHSDPWQAEGGTGHSAVGVYFDSGPTQSQRVNGQPGAGYSVLGTANTGSHNGFELGYCWLAGETNWSAIQFSDKGKGAQTLHLHHLRFLGGYGGGGHGYIRLSDQTLAASNIHDCTGPDGLPISQSQIIGATALRTG